METFRLPVSKIPAFKDLCYLILDNIIPKPDSLKGVERLNCFSQTLGHKDFNVLIKDSKLYGKGSFEWSTLYSHLLEYGPSTLKVPISSYGPALFKASSQLENLYADVECVSGTSSLFSKSWANEEKNHHFIPEGLFSCDGMTLMKIQKKSRQEAKLSGRSYQEILFRESMIESHNSSDLAYKAMFLPVRDKEVHRILVKNTVLTLRVVDKELWLEIFELPAKPTRVMRYSTGSVVYGDVTNLSLSDGSDKDINGFLLTAGWWLCKYELSQPRIGLSQLSNTHISWVEQFFRIGAVHKDLIQAPVFQSVIRWAKEHPRIAAKGSNTYFPNWGSIALAAG